MVTRLGNHWICRQCGQVVTGVRPDKKPREVVVSTSGQRTVRTLLVDGSEIHRCALGVDFGSRSGRSGFTSSWKLPDHRH
jgi:hypothetical protein